MGLEINAFLFDFSEGRKRKDLKATAIGKYWTVPAHKLIQATHVVDKAIPGSHMKMIGVAKLYLTL